MSIQVLPTGGTPSSRIGRALGQGLSEQLPKEVERYRLSQGLKNLGQKQGLDPFQQFSELAAIPGITPQMIQSGAELLRQRGIGNALRQKANQGAEQKTQRQPSPFPRVQNNIENENVSPSVTTPEGVEATTHNYIPPSLPEIQQLAGKLYEESPELYPTPEKAMEAAVMQVNQEKAINEAFQQRRQNENDVQRRVQDVLQNQQKQLGAIVPGTVFSSIEDKAINAVKSKEEGGEGLTEQAAGKKYGKELDEVARDYKQIDTLGTWRLLSKDRKENRNSLKSLQKKFKARDDALPEQDQIYLENFADSMISKNNLSPAKAYYMAYPVSDEKELNNALTKIPKLESENLEKRKGLHRRKGINNLEQKTLEISKKLAPILGNGSPLSVAEELRERNYDPSVWMNYLRENRDKLRLNGRQGREIDKTINPYSTLDDMWLFLNIGLDKLVEQ